MYPASAIETHIDTNRSHGSTSNLIDSEQKTMSRSESPPQNSKLRDFLRHVRLLFPGSLLTCRLPWGHKTEQRKVAAYQSRRMAALFSLLHAIPFIGATTLLAFYWTKYWIGRETVALTALQFVAKLHEILMQASLVEILVYIIRSHALKGYVPLGALWGAAQASQISYLWSLDFLAVLGSSNLKAWRRVAFGLTVSTLLVMITIVGPSSAVLMIPRPDMANNNATRLRYLNVSEVSLYPTYVDGRYKSSFNA
jgi:hypothetical protein